MQSMGPVRMPMWPGIKSAAHEDNLTSLLLQVHVDKLHRFKQLGIQERCGKVVKFIILCVAWKGWVDLLAEKYTSFSMI